MFKESYITQQANNVEWRYMREGWWEVALLT